MLKTTVEDIILENDRRGISFLKPYLPADYCGKAALAVLNCPGTAFIVTGFHIADANSPETDGPPGAIALAGALTALGCKVCLVTDRFSSALLQSLSEGTYPIIVFPLADYSGSQAFAADVLAEHAPSVIISIERCGVTADGTYLDMRGQDISDCNAKIDCLFAGHPNTIGIGDGGNEIGMGNYAEIIPRSGKLVNRPGVTRTTHTIISSASNWGAYGLIAELSGMANRNLLLSPDDEADLIRRSVECGAVDGVSGKREPRVDGFDLRENGELLSKLHQYLGRKSQLQ